MKNSDGKLNIKLAYKSLNLKERKYGVFTFINIIQEKIMKINKKAIIATLIITLISLATDHLNFDFTSFELLRYIKIKIIYAIVLIILGQLIAMLFSLAKKDKEILASIRISGICTIFLLICLIITYPGIWGWDNMEMLKGASELTLGGWHGIYMEYFFVFSLMLCPFPAGIVIIQILLVSIVIGREFYLLYTVIDNKKLAYISLITLVLPENLFWALSPYRITVFGSLVGLAVLEFVLMKKVYKGSILYYIILYSFIWALRGEGYILLLFIPVVAFTILKLGGLKKGLLYLLISMVMVLIVKTPVNSNRAYLTMSLMNPMEIMVKYDLTSDDINRDLQAIDKVFDVQIMKNSNSTVYAVNGPESAWSTKGFLDNIYCSDEQWNDMLKAYANVIFFNPQLFAKLRWKTMWGSMTSFRGNIAEIGQLVNSEAGQFMFDSFWLSSPISENIRQSFGGLLGCLGKICGTSVIPVCIIIAIFILGIITKKTELWIPSMILILMIGCVFLTEPASNSSYFYSIYNSAYILIIYFIIEAADWLYRTYKQHWTI